MPFGVASAAGAHWQGGRALGLAGAIDSTARAALAALSMRVKGEFAAAQALLYDHLRSCYETHDRSNDPGPEKSVVGVDRELVGRWKYWCECGVRV